MTVVAGRADGFLAAIGRPQARDEPVRSRTCRAAASSNISFRPMFSVWPRVGLSYAGVNESAPLGSDDKHLQLNVSVPFMFHPLNHFFVGFGPAVDVDVTGHSKTTTIAGRVILGGWF